MADRYDANKENRRPASAARCVSVGCEDLFLQLVDRLGLKRFLKMAADTSFDRVNFGRFPKTIRFPKTVLSQVLEMSANILNTYILHPSIMRDILQFRTHSVTTSAKKHGHSVRYQQDVLQLNKVNVCKKKSSIWKLLIHARIK